MAENDSLFGADDMNDEPLCKEEPEAGELDAPAVSAAEVHATGGLTHEEQERFRKAVSATWAVPFVGDIRDFVWEAIFHYVKGLSIPDPLASGTSKLLFDVVDSTTGKGWSQKALQISNAKAKNPRPDEGFEFVIQNGITGQAQR